MLMALNHAYCRIYHDLRVISPPKLPRTGPAIIVCNHISGVDPLLIQSACPRLITWMMASEYYDIKPLRWVFTTVGAIPVDRSGRDMSATRAAMRALEAGQVLGVFPEGRIEESRGLLPFQTGVALLASRGGVPVYPAALEGTNRGRDMIDAFIKPCTALLKFGERIQFDRSSKRKQALEEATELLQARVEALRQLEF
jgi:1-acyl-sn-glycerol-3-phosphate acyltransferase